MSALKPGLYRATVRGVANVTVLIRATGYGFTPDYIAGVGSFAPDEITDARPLIVLDTNALSARNIAQILRSSGYAGIADQIEAQTKPARIPEPLHWGSKVRSSTGRTFVLLDIGSLGRRWIDEYSGILWAWGDLIDPVLLREGVTE